MAHVLGVDKNIPSRICHGKWSYELTNVDGLIPAEANVPQKCKVHLTDGKAEVLLEKDGSPVFTVNHFGKGKGIYLSSFEKSTVNNRLLMNILLFSQNIELNADYITDNTYTECAFYPASKKLVVINNTDQAQSTTINTEFGQITVDDIAPFGTVIKQL